jgi:hypothetical protein
MTSSEAAAMVGGRGEGGGLRELAREVAWTAIEKGSTDNCTIAIMKL